MTSSRSGITIDFICAGAQKAGTTWLYDRLDELPDYSLLPFKELHYFDRSRAYPSPDTLADTFLYQRVLRRNWRVDAFRDLSKALREKNVKKLKWLTKWYFSSYTDEWYLSLFESVEGIKGEVTPDYSMLKKEDIARMYNLAPQAKIIFLLRNPVERAWSHFRYNKFVLKQPDLTSPELDNREIIYFTNKKGQELRSDYMRTLENYTQIYPGNQILVGFFDELSDHPKKLLSDIVRFTGGDPSNISTYCNLDTKNNVSPKIAIPEEIELYLKEKYFPMIKKLSDTYGSYFTKWYIDLYECNKSIDREEILYLAFVMG